MAAMERAPFDVLEGEFVAIVGPSGCGKSTVLNMIGGLVTPSGGAVLIDGAPVRDVVPPRVGYAFQKDTVFPWRTVAGNIALGLQYRGVAAAERARRVREAVALAGLDGFEDAFPVTLSGGMRQRVALMRTLVVDPSGEVRLSLWQMALSTVQSTLWGFAVRVSTGFVAGLVRGCDERLARIFEPCIIVFFNTFQGARAVDVDLVHSARFLGAGERQILRTVIVPSALAWTFAALTPSISFALIGVVVGELLGGESGGGLGYLITQSLGTLNAADMMVALVSLGVIGILMAVAIKQVERRLLRWRPEYRTERA